jgi:proton-dependent oligopeptide transporter, POT family
MLKHPKGLYVLFFTELWERYSFYSMMAILSLYMNESLHFDVAHVGRIYGLYTAGVYFLPLFGGLLADRVFGFNRAIIAGGVLMMCGHLVLGVEALPFFYLGLVLLASGSGLLKPNLSTLVGNLYRDRPQLRDQGYSIYYMGINIGGFISPITVAWIRMHYGYSPAFMSAAIAMLISLAVYTIFNRHLREAARKVDEGAEPTAAVSSSDARQRVITLLVVFVISTVFWLAWYQIFYTFTFFARDNLSTGIAPEQFSSFESFGVIVFTPLMVAFWAWLMRRNLEPSTPVKMLIGLGLLAVAFSVLGTGSLAGGDTGRVTSTWLITTNLIMAFGEIALSPIGMSLVNRLSPPRQRGLLMGGWFASLATGGYLAGQIGVFWERVPHHQFFFGIAAVLIVFGLPLSFMTPQIKRTLARAEA